MKKIIVVILLLSLSLFVLSISGCAKEEDPLMFLKAVGKDIVTDNGNGEVILLQGVNAGGYLVIEEWMSPVNVESQFVLEDVLYDRFGDDSSALLDTLMDNWWTEDDFDKIANMGMNVIRLPFTWRTLQNKDYTYKDNAFSRMDWFVEQAAARGLYVILDLHGAHGSQNGKDHSGDISTGGDLYTNELNMTRTEELWVTVANHYKDNPMIAGYDLLNEPEGTHGGIMTKDTPHWDYYDRLYKAIREVDTNHIIIIESVWEHYNLPKPSVYGWKNVVYEYHYYMWDDYSNSVKQRIFLSQKVLNSTLANHNVPEYVGEFSFFDNPDSWVYGLRVFREQGWSWTVWTYKVIGNNSWGIYNYIDDDCRVDPYADSYDEILEKWSKLKTNENFVVNQWLLDVLTIPSDN